MTARRPLLTALGATTLLAALWFVPSANATAPEGGAPAGQAGRAAPAAANTDGPGAADAGADAAGGQGTASEEPVLGLADTGGVDTTPYLLAGTACLIVGAASVTFSVRHSRNA
ncbi:hypothetical protein AB0953_08210 [Streptomyces sp. NPDC046866]|uniref:hypothetical protein n=1 Tax=Streptomyces sp. NPDC046866 TaxID=3154921 RepID=UPI00345471FC